MYISKLFFLNVLCLFYIDKVLAFNSTNFTTIRDYRDRYTHDANNYTTASVNASFFGIQPLSAEARCTDGTSEVARTLAVYNVGSDSGKADLAIHSLDTLMGYFGQTNRLSFKYQTDDIVGFMWLGSMVQNEGAKEIMQKLQDIIKSQGMKDTIYAQYTDVSTHDPAKGFGIILNTQGDLDMVQSAVRSWSRGHDFRGTDAGRSATINSYLCYTSYADRKTGGNDGEAGDCEYKRMTSGANVGDLCGTTSEAVQMYNPDIDFSKLAVGQPICCTEGKSPDLRPSKNSDGSCKVFQFKDGDSCATVKAKYYPLSDDELNEFNKKTFGWYGCNDHEHLPQIDQKICVSDGTPPRPEPNPEAECGPLAPGDKYNSECPLNACCSEFGFCGLTEEFCKKTTSDTGAPGTEGCINNCKLPYPPEKVSTPDHQFLDIKYFLTSDGPLKMDPQNIDADIIQYAFVNLDPNTRKVNTDSLGEDFNNFLNLGSGIKKVASFGGWDFSTNPTTYKVFREGVKPENRDSFANVFVGFARDYNLDGIDIDWEYPGAPDIPGIPADDPDNGENYYEFLKIVKSRLGNSKTLSVALPASYWYLKAFPVEKIQDTVDYFIYMNYDYYGQWDYSKGIGIGCHVDYRNTTSAIGTLNKAGVDPTKIVGGIGNYGRSYKLSDPTCKTYGCGFTGPNSGAEPGPDTQTAGVLSDHEINEFSKSKSGYTETYDSESKCTISTFDTNQWVAFMKNDAISSLIETYKEYNYYGSVTWVANYAKDDEDQKYNTCNVENITTFDILTSVPAKCNNKILIKNFINMLEENIKVFNTKIKHQLQTVINTMNSEYGFTLSDDYINDIIDEFKNLENTYLPNLKNYDNDKYIEGVLFSSYTKISSVNMYVYACNDILDNKLAKRGTISDHGVRIAHYFSSLTNAALLSMDKQVFSDLNKFEINYPGIGAEYMKSYAKSDYEKRLEILLNSKQINAQEYVQAEKDEDQLIQDMVNGLMKIEPNPDPLAQFVYLPNLELSGWGNIDADYGDPFNHCPKHGGCSQSACGPNDWTQSNCINGLSHMEGGWEIVKSIFEYHKELDSDFEGFPVYVMNIDGQSPGAVCNAMQYTTSMQILGLEENYLISLHSYVELSDNPKDPNRGYLQKYLCTNYDSTNDYGLPPDRVWQKDEFPMFAMGEGYEGDDVYTLSIMCIHPDDNWIEGQNYNRFVAANPPGKSNRLRTRKLVKNNWAYNYPNVEESGLRKGRLSTGDPFLVLTHNIPDNCDEYFEVPWLRSTRGRRFTNRFLYPTPPREHINTLSGVTTVDIPYDNETLQEFRHKWNTTQLNLAAKIH